MRSLRGFYLFKYLKLAQSSYLHFNPPFVNELCSLPPLREISLRCNIEFEVLTPSPTAAPFPVNFQLVGKSTLVNNTAAGDLGLGR